MKIHSCANDNWAKQVKVLLDSYGFAYTLYGVILTLLT